MARSNTLKTRLKFLKRRNTIIIFMLVLLCTAVMISIMPRYIEPKLIYEEGHPWMFAEIIAEYDFPIMKDISEVNQERDSLRKMREPYFNYDENILQQQLQNFDNDCKENEWKLPWAMTNALRTALTEVYEKGIVSDAKFTEIAADTLHNIRIVNGMEATAVRIVELYTPKTAYLHISESATMEPFKTQLQAIDLQEYLRPNLIYDLSRNAMEEEELEAQVPLTCGLVEKGEKIVERGQIVTPKIAHILRSFEEANTKRTVDKNNYYSTMAGQALYVLVMVSLLLVYIHLFRRDYFEKLSLLVMVFVLITAFSVAVSLMMRHTFFSVYYLPFAVVPMLVRVFLDSRTAFVAHVIMVLICACAVKYQYEFIIIQLIAGATAIYSMRHLTKRSDVFISAIYVTVVSCIMFFALQLMQDKRTSDLDDSFYYHFIANGVMLLFAYPAMYLTERIFGFVSDVTLIELSNPSSPLLRNLSMVAPGTFQHCTMVGNLAAEIAEKIGADATLVRTGALYHDIGKTANPAYYIENQKGMSNPLETKDRKEAAKIIISHVTEGIRLAKEQGLPQDIIDFIRTHHGAGLTKYFYLNYKKEHPEEEVDPADFTYEGPNPQTTEQAILMMADTVEAASRSLPDYSEKSITELVNNIIDNQVAEKYYEECPINFRDISDAKQVLIDRLMAIYHTRIAYPKG